MLGRALGFDIGGTAVKAGRLGMDGTIEMRLERPSPAGEPPLAMAALLAEMARELQQGGAPGRTETSGLAGSPLPIGIGCAGLVDPRAGAVLTSPNLPGWTENAPLAALVRDATGTLPVLLNDANAFVLAETRLGAARGFDSVIGITLGTGVGGGLILGGALWTGTHGAAGEIGHMPLQIDGPLCACGARGCLEALVGSRALLGRYGAYGGTAGACDPLTVVEVARRAGAGESAALLTFRETGRILGLGLAGLVQLLDPELFVIGGGISRSAGLFLPAARDAMLAAAMLPDALCPRIVEAELGVDAGWIGAARAAAESAT